MSKKELYAAARKWVKEVRGELSEWDIRLCRNSGAHPDEYQIIRDENLHHSFIQLRRALEEADGWMKAREDIETWKETDFNA